MTNYEFIKSLSIDDMESYINTFEAPYCLSDTEEGCPNQYKATYCYQCIGRWLREEIPYKNWWLKE